MDFTERIYLSDLEYEYNLYYKIQAGRPSIRQSETLVLGIKERNLFLSLLFEPVFEQADAGSR